MLQKNSKSNILPTVGLFDQIRIGNYDHVVAIIQDLHALNVKEIRLEFYLTKLNDLETIKWYDQLFSLLSKEFTVLPCVLNELFFEVNNNLSPAIVIPDFEHAPDLLEIFINRYGVYFDTIELLSHVHRGSLGYVMNHPFPEYLNMLSKCATHSKLSNKKVILGGIDLFDEDIIQFFFENELMTNIDIIGIRCLPHNILSWNGWNYQLKEISDLLQKNKSDCELWITQTGYATNDHEDFDQIEAFKKCLVLNVDKIFWSSLYDLSISDQNIKNYNPHPAGMGLKEFNGSPKLLYRLWQKYGINQLNEISYLKNMPLYISNHGYTLITGGAGFIGTNLAEKLLSEGKRVMIFDNLSREGVEENLRWIHQKYRNKVQINIGDVRHFSKIQKAVSRADEVFHLAAQVAVTTSLHNPFHDFEVNAKGTLNILEAMRNRSDPPSLIFTSTNKVYGSLPDLEFIENISRYQPELATFADKGISEAIPLDFHSPYGCSKGAADQYVLDYARTFNLPAAVFRMSCIYGPYQFGTEDQGWVAHFMISAMNGRRVSIFGDGKQVRDILYVQDLVNAFRLAQNKMDSIKGNAFNIGGGISNTISLLELLNMLEEITGTEIETEFSD